jgi:IclR family transcriptional regulator, acetate operon repressor
MTSVAAATLGEPTVAPRAVVRGAFDLLASLRALGSARVSELQRRSGLPRTTVHRLLAQLEDVGAVERSAGRWRLGPTVLRLGAEIPAEPRLRAVASRPLLELANLSGALAALSVEIAGQGMVVDVLPGTRALAIEPVPGMVLDRAELAAAGLQAPRLASVRAHEHARRGDLRPVVDAGAVDPRVSCVAAPLRLSGGDVAAVWLMVPGRAGVPAPMVAATRRAAGRIASQLPKPGPSTNRRRWLPHDQPTPGAGA